MTLKELRSVPLKDLSPHPLSDELFGQMGEEELTLFTADIEKRGLLHPLEADDALRVVCGSQRLRALRRLNPNQTIPVLIRDFENEEELQEHLIKDNLLKRNLTPVQLYKAGERLEAIYKAIAQKNSALGRKGHSIPSEQKIRTRDQVAKTLHTSSTTYWRLQKVMRSRNTPLIEQVNQGEISLSKAIEELSFKAQPIKDPKQQDVINFIKFNRHLNQFFKYLQGHQLPSFHTYEKQARKALKILEHRITLMQ